MLGKIPSVPSSTSAPEPHYPHIYTNPMQSRLRRYDVPQMPCASYMAFAHHRRFHHHSTLRAPILTPTTQLTPAILNKPYYPIIQFYNQITIHSSHASTAKMSGLRLLTTRVAGRAPSARLFTTTAAVKKTATETAKETIQKANKTAGEAGVAAIEKGRTSFSFIFPFPSPSALQSHPITLHVPFLPPPTSITLIPTVPRITTTRRLTPPLNRTSHLNPKIHRRPRHSRSLRLREIHDWFRERNDRRSEGKSE